MFGKLLFPNRRKRSPYEDDVVVDLHSHLIPGIDDGASSLEESVEMIAQMANLGYTHLYTTPHIMWDCYKNEPLTIREGLAELREVCQDEGIDITLDAAAEYFIDEHFLELLHNDEDLMTLPGNRVLIELPYTTPLLHFSETVFSMVSKGYTPVLAHPERYTYFYSNPEVFRQLTQQGCELQLNALSLLRYYGSEARKMAQWLLDNKLVTFLGTDAHHLHHVKLLNEARQNKILSRYPFLNNKIKSL